MGYLGLNCQSLIVEVVEISLFVDMVSSEELASDEVSVVVPVEVVSVSGSVEVVAGELVEDSVTWSSCVGSRA